MYEVIGLTISGFTGAFSGWFFTRKKNTAETTGIEIENAKEIIAMQKEFNSQMKEQLNESQELISTQQRIIDHFTAKCSQIKICKPE